MERKSERRRGSFPRLICGENRELSITPDRRLVFADPREEKAHRYLAGYSLCADLLRLGRGEPAGREGMPAEIAGADESFWEFRRMEIRAALAAMPTTRESTLLYCRYIKGESVERFADRIGISRRSAYRMYHRALVSFCNFRERRDRQRKEGVKEAEAEDAD